MTTYVLEVDGKSLEYKRAEVRLLDQIQNSADKAVEFECVERYSKTKGKREEHYGLLDDKKGIWVDKGFRGMNFTS